MAIGTVAAVVAGASLIGGRRASKKAAAAQEAANEAQRKINRLKNKQARRQFLRNYRQQAANTISGAIAAGVGLESSAFQGMTQSLKAQRNVALDEFYQMDQLGAEYTGYMNAASSRNAQAQRWGVVGGFAQQFISFSGSPNETPATTTTTQAAPTLPGGG